MTDMWFTALLWQQCGNVHGQGMSAHFLNVYNAVDFVMLKCYLACLCLSVVINLQVRPFQPMTSLFYAYDVKYPSRLLYKIYVNFQVRHLSNEKFSLLIRNSVLYFA